MSGLSFIERLSALDKPDEANDTEQIWMIIRTFLGIVRVLIFVSIIIIAEMLEEIFIGNLSLAVWSLVLGIPLFILLSTIIILGNKKFLAKKSKPEKTAVLRPILKRV
jgi:membrane protein implicated in regulation of membrane protease activity